MPPDLHSLIHGWYELESDPGLFTSLLKDLGVNGVELKEIYDLTNELERPIYGFIFLFRWIEERRYRRNIVNQTDIYVKDNDIINNMFFARQKITNSCATHALLSVLLNSPDIDIGEILQRIKGYTMGMDPENKGWAIGNTPEVAWAHNSHAKRLYVKSDIKNKKTTTKFTTGDAYHYVSFLPINGHLYELDGLKPFPMNHGSWASNEDWTDKFKKIISDRLGEHNDVRFNLMAVVPDNRLAITRTLNNLRTNKLIISETVQINLKQHKFKNDLKIKTINIDNDQCVKKEMSPIPGTSKDLNKVKIYLESEDSSPKKMENEFLKEKCGSKGFTHPTSPLFDKKKEYINKTNGPMSTPDLLVLKREIQQEIKNNEGILLEENEKHHKYKIDNCRRNHNYDNFISTFIAMLAEKRLLPKIVQEELDHSSRTLNQTQVKSKTTTSTTTKRKTTRKSSTKKKM